MIHADFTLLAENLEASSKYILTKMAEEAACHVIDFSKPWDYSDITFVAEGRHLYVSKMILALWSPVFEAMFRNNFKEKTAREIELPGKQYDSLVELMKVLHPPNKDICGENVAIILPLAEEYQMEKITERCEDFLLSQASSIKNFLLAQKYDLKSLYESSFSYLKRAPVSRLKSQAEFESLDKQVIMDVLIDKCEKFETHLESLREVRMVLERKKPTTFPGMHMLCENCTDAREQQVDCSGCMKNCCKKITEILRSIDR